MKSRIWVSIVFLIAAVYDGGLGGLFLFDPHYAFTRFEVTPPNHLGYIQFPAALLIVFAIMFLAITFRPVANRGLIPYGILLKLSYVGVAGWHWYGAGIPAMWKPLVIIDAVMAVVFAVAWLSLGKSRG